VQKPIPQLRLNRSTADPSIDIIFDVMWSVELEPEVEQWMTELSAHDFASVLPHVERLAERGNLLRMPASRALGDGLFELRFDVFRVAWRITYFSPLAGASCC
jgi:hypothetical protein